MWGDAQGNRANRYLGVVAALDGVNKYAVSQRGYHHSSDIVIVKPGGGARRSR